MNPVWISAAGSILAVLLSFVALVQKNSSDSATLMAKLEVKLDSISEDLRDLKKGSSEQQHKIDELREKFIILERDQATIWKRIDELKLATESLKKGAMDGNFAKASGLA